MSDKKELDNVLCNKCNNYVKNTHLDYHLKCCNQEIDNKDNNIDIKVIPSESQMCDYPKKDYEDTITKLEDVNDIKDINIINFDEMPVGNSNTINKSTTKITNDDEQNKT